MQFSKTNILYLLILIAICFSILIPINPNHMPYTHRDSGVFLYTGWRITEGELPYRDVWDHKPPVIFYINALGLSLTNGSRWGVWYIECISLLITGIIGFILLKKIFNNHVAFISMFIFVGSLHFLLTGGNITNEYILPLQMFSLLIILSLNRDHFKKSNFVLLGIMAALAFFTKQTTIGIWLGILIYHTIICLQNRRFKKWIEEISLFLLGGFFVSTIVIGYFAMNHGLVDFYSAGLKFNYVYASLGMSIIERIKAFQLNFSSLEPAGIVILGLIGVLIAILLIWKKSVIIEKHNHVFVIALITLPIEIFFISLSGRGYDHYFISIIPVLTIFSGMTFWILYKQLEEWNVSSNGKQFFSMGLFVLFVFVLYQPYIEENKGNKWINDSSVVKYIGEITTPEDTLVIWGAEAKDYYFSKRVSSTKYIYLYPLYTHNYTSEELIISFLDEIIEEKPKIIIDTKSISTPFLEFPIESSEISSRISWISDNYYELEPLGDWIVYKLDIQ